MHILQLSAKLCLMLKLSGTYCAKNYYACIYNWPGHIKNHVASYKFKNAFAALKLY